MDEHEDELREVLLAKYGPQVEHVPGDVLVLGAPQLHQVTDALKYLRARRLSCDECSGAIYVSDSSQWLLDMREDTGLVSQTDKEDE